MKHVMPRDSQAADPKRLFAALFLRGVGANAVGAVLAFVYLSFISPPQPPPPHDEAALYLGIAPLYVVVVAAVAYRMARRQFRPIEQWLVEGRSPTEHERRLLLSTPWRGAAQAALGWFGAAITFGVVTATHHPLIYVGGVVVGIVLAGLTSTAVTFLIAERTLRPTFAIALAGGGAPDSDSLAIRVIRTRPRLLASWALGSGIALMAIPLAFLGRGDSTGDELIGPVLFLVIAGLFGGGVLIAAAASSVSEPIDRLRTAAGRVEEGSLDEEVAVDDGGEVGRLQAGFNRMVKGLREREQIREMFGTYVDREVAEHILREGPSLEGEEIEVTVMFIDIRDFTGFAERSSAREVVATINRLFERVVPIVHAHRGHVDKFVGDGLLAVFGAPRPDPRHADQALAAAKQIVDAAGEAFGESLQIGIGLNSGAVVAGNVGGAGRLEFSVIGDAVNVAARVEAATRQTGDTILLTERTKELLHTEAPLTERPGVALKGKREAVSVYAPPPSPVPR